MTIITQADLTKLLAKYADSDMRRVRKSHALCITETKKGNIDLTYNPTSKMYSAHHFNMGTAFFTDYNASATKKFLMETYDVVLTDTQVIG